MLTLPLDDFAALIAMGSEFDGLSAEQIQAASDPISCKDLFWEALAQGDERVALDAAARIRLPPVQQQTAFPFPDEGEGKTAEVDDVDEINTGRGFLILIVII